MVWTGHTDMITELSMLEIQFAMPREGHLEAIFHIYAYFKIKHNSRMIFDHIYPDIDMIQLQMRG